MSQTIYDTTPMRQVFKEGTWDVKLSFLVMGLANLVNKQFTKGLLFLLSEIAFLVAFVIQIIPALKGMITLGTQEQGEAIILNLAWLKTRICHFPCCLKQIHHFSFLKIS